MAGQRYPVANRRARRPTVARRNPAGPSCVRPARSRPSPGVAEWQPVATPGALGQASPTPAYPPTPEPALGMSGTTEQTTQRPRCAYEPSTGVTAGSAHGSPFVRGAQASQRYPFRHWPYAESCPVSPLPATSHADAGCRRRRCRCHASPRRPCWSRSRRLRAPSAGPPPCPRGECPVPSSRHSGRRRPRRGPARRRRSGGCRRPGASARSWCG